MTPDASPRNEYTARLTERRRSAQALERVSARFAWLRLALGIATAGLLWAVTTERGLAWPWLGAPIVAFLAVARVHDRVLRRRSAAERGAAHYERALARLDGRWAGEGTPGDEHADPNHPYAADLDLFGHGSLFELICTARTRDGERVLAEWLKTQGQPEQVRMRQQAVDELRDRIDLREDLAVLGEDVRAGVDTRALAAWAQGPPLLESRWPLRVASALAALDLLALGAWLSGLAGPQLLLGASALAGVFAWSQRARVRTVLQSVGGPTAELRLLTGVLDRLERERFTTPLLRGLREALDEEGAPPSRSIGRLARLSEWNDSRRNQIFLPLAGLVLLGTHLAFAIERWRKAHAASVARWIASVAEMEALGSLAAYAREHPSDPFPEITPDGPRFEAVGLGHPLVDEQRCVRNDVRLGGELRLLLVSGSNMSGKSTLLRSVGINAVLGLAGAPVRAHRLVLSSLRPGACLRVQDSLQEGTSRFYAEILRLRTLVDLARGDSALLFLLDEVLHGTNSHDRRIGAEGLIHGLIRQGALGMVTTHDLALAKIADDLGTAAANVHFEDHLEDGKIAFDYRLRPGVVEKSNALALMRAVGLDV